MADGSGHGLGYEIAAGIMVALSGIGSVFVAKKKSKMTNQELQDRCHTMQEKLNKLEAELLTVSNAVSLFKHLHNQAHDDIREIKEENARIHDRITTQGREVSEILGILKTNRNS